MTAASSPRTTGVSALGRFLGVPFRLQTYRNLTYLALAFPLGLLYFLGVTVGFSLGVGLFVTWIGLPILVVTVAGATVVAGFEAELARRLVGVEVPFPEVLRNRTSDEEGTDPEGRFLASLKRLLVAPTTWSSVLLVLLKFGFGILAFVALVTAGSLGASMLVAPFLYDDPFVTYQLGAFVIDTFAESVAVFVAGVLLTLAALHLLNALARLGGLLTAALLGVGGSEASEGPESGA